MQYQEKVVQSEEKVVQCEEKVYSIWNFTSAVQVEKVCTTRRVAAALQGEGCGV